MTITHKEFRLDIEGIRERAEQGMDGGAVTKGYKGDRTTIVRLLNESLATELVCVLRYKRHYFMSASVGGIAGFAITEELKKHADEEQGHADQLAARIVQLGGAPNFDPDGLSKRAHASYGTGSTLTEMLEEDLVAERIAIQVYSEIIRYIGDADITTRRLLESILAQEEEHADEMADFLKRLRDASIQKQPETAKLRVVSSRSKR
jgi:bacterioferritin